MAMALGCWVAEPLKELRRTKASKCNSSFEWLPVTGLLLLHLQNTPGASASDFVSLNSLYEANYVDVGVCQSGCTS